MSGSEFHDAYEDKERIRGVLLSLPISELTLNAPVLVDAGDSAADAIKAMIDRHIGCVLVQKNGKLVGIFTERMWQIFWRVTVDGNSATAVAEEFGATPAAVRQIKSRILRRLKQIVGDVAQ